MKARTYPVVLSLVCGLAFGMDAATPAGSFTYENPDDATMAEIRQVGEWAIDRIGTALVIETQRTLIKSSAAEAVWALHLKNFKLPQTRLSLPQVNSFKRTSLQLRNPANTPDAAERDVLNRIKDQLERAKEVPEIFIQKVSTPGQPTEWRVYRPVATLRQCLVCHGDAKTLDPAAVAALKQAYPDDAAVDYRHGEWRGLIRVSVIPPSSSK